MAADFLFRIVGIRADGSKQVLCDKLQSTEAGQRYASYLLDARPIARIFVERDDVPLIEPQNGVH